MNNSFLTSVITEWDDLVAQNELLHLWASLELLRRSLSSKLFYRFLSSYYNADSKTCGISGSLVFTRSYASQAQSHARRMFFIAIQHWDKFCHLKRLLSHSKDYTRRNEPSVSMYYILHDSGYPIVKISSCEDEIKAYFPNFFSRLQYC